MPHYLTSACLSEHENQSIEIISEPKLGRNGAGGHSGPYRFRPIRASVDFRGPPIGLLQGRGNSP